MPEETNLREAVARIAKLVKGLPERVLTVENSQRINLRPAYKNGGTEKSGGVRWRVKPYALIGATGSKLGLIQNSQSRVHHKGESSAHCSQTSHSTESRISIHR